MNFPHVLYVLSLLLNSIDEGACLRSVLSTHSKLLVLLHLRKLCAQRISINSL